MTIVGILFTAAGAAITLATLIHDVRRGRIGREFGGQAAPSRIAPEVHAVAAVLVGVGIGVSFGWWQGILAAVGFGAVVYGVIRPLIDR
jgi:hypothetical protein